jgi:protein SCO1/2
MLVGSRVEDALRRYAPALVLLALAMTISPADAHHPGADLDTVMGSKERYFQAVDRRAPPLSLRAGDGRDVTWTDYARKVVVLHFIYASCPDVCPLHAEKLAEVQAMINQSAMKDLVEFVTITTDPSNDTPDVLDDYGRNRGFDAASWSHLTTRPDQGEGTTRALAKAFGHTFTRTDEGYQTHGVVTHIVDRDGRWAGNFHGLRFEAVNLVLYINGLINRAHAPAKGPEPGWWDRLRSYF